MPDNEPRTLLCGPTDTVAETEVVPGSQRRWCTICGTEVWVSPEGLAMCDRHPKTTVVCLRCGIGVMADADDPIIEPIPGIRPDTDDIHAIHAIKQVAAQERAARRAR